MLFDSQRCGMLEHPLTCLWCYPGVTPDRSHEALYAKTKINRYRGC